LVNSQGIDVTKEFVRGAKVVLGQAQRHFVRQAFLKDRSPSCGFDPQGLNPAGGPGLGVLSALLRAEGIEVTEVRADAQPSLTVL
jgi:uncharacterized protein YbbK (DUF523 family)